MIATLFELVAMFLFVIGAAVVVDGADQMRQADEFVEALRAARDTQ